MAGALFKPRFLAHHTFSVSDVDSKLTEKAVVDSSPFFCRHDPAQTKFYIQLKFAKDKEGFLSGYVHNKCRTVTYTKIFFQVFNDEGSLLDEKLINEAIESSKGTGYGFPDLFEFSGKANVLNIIVTFEYEGEPSKPSVSNVATTDSRLHQDYSKLLDSAKFSDLTFLVQGEEIKAHKNILFTRCSYFETMFESKMEENDTNEIKVSDFSPAVFKELLKFLYSGLVPTFKDGETLHLLVAADKYGLDDLKNVCESIICSNLTVDNVIDALLMAEMHNCPDLMERASKVFRMFADELKKKECWNKLKQNPDLLLKLLSKFLV